MPLPFPGDQDMLEALATLGQIGTKAVLLCTMGEVCP